jgi:sugar lactone lactonase YvrE
MSYLGFSGSNYFRALIVSAFLFTLAACQARSLPTPDQTGAPVTASLAAPTQRVIPRLEPALPATVPIRPTGPALIDTPTPHEKPLILDRLKVVVLAEHLSNPDDLALAPDGSIYISDIKDGSILQYSADGKLKTILNGLDEPEGMVFLQDGALIIAEQGKNRLIRYDFQTRSVSVFANLTNQTAQAGVDGIALDERAAADSTLIIPDSPNGVILRLSLDGKTVSEIAHGFSRPTAAWVEKDGSILIVDENAHSLSRIHPDGRVQLLAQNLPTPDDVIEDNTGHIFVNTLTDSAIHVLSLDGRQDSILVGHLAGPQGESFDPDGNLIVTDSGNGRLLKIMIH